MYNCLRLNISSSHPEVFGEKGVFKNFAKFSEKRLCQSLVFIWIIFCLYFKVFCWWLWACTCLLGKLEKSNCCCLNLLNNYSNTYTKLATVTLKQDVKFVKSRDCVSLLKTCNMSDPLSSVFLVYYQHVFVYCNAFILSISFLITLLSILNSLTTWAIFSVIRFRPALGRLIGWFFSWFLVDSLLEFFC